VAGYCAIDNACLLDGSRHPTWSCLACDNATSGHGWTDQCGAQPRLVITEFMANPNTVADSVGEWIELFNPTAAPIELQGMTLKDLDVDSHVIAKSVVVAPGAYVVVGRSDDRSVNGNVGIVYTLDHYALGNFGDEILLLDRQGNELDRVVFDSSWIVPGSSCALRSPTSDNSQLANWCVSSKPWGSGDNGSPGQANQCP
jgi:hypothetical protein